MSDVQSLLFLKAALVPIGAAAVGGIVWLFRKHLPDGRLKDVLVGDRVGNQAAWIMLWVGLAAVYGYFVYLAVK